MIDQTIDLRRAIDVLLMQPGIDNERIAFVGHDYGAMFGSIMAGIDKRVKACVLVTGMGNFGDWSLKYWKKPSARRGRVVQKVPHTRGPDWLHIKCKTNFTFLSVCKQGHLHHQGNSPSIL